MRLILTTIILTMLAQPVWAYEADVRLTCNNLRAELNLQTGKSLSLYKMALEPSDKLTEDASKMFRVATEKKAKSYLDTASKLATIYNALCKE